MQFTYQKECEQPLKVDTRLDMALYGSILVGFDRSLAKKEKHFKF